MSLAMAVRLEVKVSSSCTRLKQAIPSLNRTRPRPSYEGSVMRFSICYAWVVSSKGFLPDTAKKQLSTLPLGVNSAKSVGWFYIWSPFFNRTNCTVMVEVENRCIAGSNTARFSICCLPLVELSMHWSIFRYRFLHLVLDLYEILHISAFTLEPA